MFLRNVLRQEQDNIDVDGKKTNENPPTTSPRQFYVEIEPDENDKKLLTKSTDS